MPAGALGRGGAFACVAFGGDLLGDAGGGFGAAVVSVVLGASRDERRESELLDFTDSFDGRRCGEGLRGLSFEGCLSGEAYVGPNSTI